MDSSNASSLRDTNAETGGTGTLLALAIGTFAIGTTEFGPMGFLPDIATGLQVTVPEAGQIVSIYAIGVTLSAPIMTLILTRLPLRTALMLAMTIFTIGNALSALAPSYSALLIARLVTSFNHGAFIGLGSVLAASVVPIEKRAGAIATMFMGLTVANIGGVPAATWISQQIGWRLAFSGIAVLGAVAIVALLRALPATEPRKVPDARRELRSLIAPPVLIAVTTSAIASAAMFAFYTYVAILLINVTGASNGFVTVCLVLTGVGFTIGNAVGGRLADWSLSGATRIILASLAVVLAALPLLLESHVGALIGVLSFGIASFAIVPPMQTRVMQAAADAPGLASSINAGAFNLGNALGAVMGGAVIGFGFGYAMVPIAGCLLACLSLLLVFLGWPQKRPMSPHARRGDIATQIRGRFHPLS